MDSRIYAKQLPEVEEKYAPLNLLMVTAFPTVLKYENLQGWSLKVHRSISVGQIAVRTS